MIRRLTYDDEQVDEDGRVPPEAAGDAEGVDARGQEAPEGVLPLPLQRVAAYDLLGTH